MTDDVTQTHRNVFAGVGQIPSRTPLIDRQRRGRADSSGRPATVTGTTDHRPDRRCGAPTPNPSATIGPGVARARPPGVTRAGSAQARTQPAHPRRGRRTRRRCPTTRSAQAPRATTAPGAGWWAPRSARARTGSSRRGARGALLSRRRGGVLSRVSGRQLSAVSSGESSLGGARAARRSPRQPGARSGVGVDPRPWCLHVDVDMSPR